MNLLHLADLCRDHLRPWASITLDGQGNPVPVFTPALSTAEQAAFDRLVRIVRSPVPSITPAEWESLEPDIAGLATYQNIASPTLAQTASAVKAQSRILRALLRN